MPPEEHQSIFDGTVYANLRDVFDLYLGEGDANEFTEEMREHLTEIRRRHTVLLMQNGSNCRVLRRKTSGEVCPYFDRTQQQCPRPIVAPSCYGTGWVGGYDDVGTIKVYFPPTDLSISWYQQGQRMERTARPWTIWTPALQPWDVLVKASSGERFFLENVTQVPEWRDLTVMQELSVRKVTDEPVKDFPLALT